MRRIVLWWFTCLSNRWESVCWMNHRRGALLHKRWRRLTLLCALSLPLGALLLRWTAQNPDFNPRRWLLIAALTVAGEFWFLRRALYQNHPPNSHELYPDLGAANLLTICRGVAYAWMAGFLFMPRPGGRIDWLPALLYLGASIADYFDGYLARRTNHVSQLGETLDIEYDGIGILVVIALAVQYGQLPAVFLLVGAGRPLFVWGMQLRKWMGLPNHPMTESDQRRLAAGLFMIFLSLALWPIFEPPATFLVGSVFGGAVALSFIRDWLVTIGWLRPAHLTYTLWRSRLKTWIFEWLPVGLRLLIAVLAALSITDILLDPSPWATRGAGVVHWLFALIGAVGGLAALFGIAARGAATLIIAAAYANFVLGSQTRQDLLLLPLASLLVIVGNGGFALWTPDERWLRSGAGKNE